MAYNVYVMKFGTPWTPEERFAIMFHGSRMDKIASDLRDQYNAKVLAQLHRALCRDYYTYGDHAR